MTVKQTRNGGKFSGKHTTVTDLAGLVADLVAKQEEVKTISTGHINCRVKPVGGKYRIKVTDEGSRLLLAVRDNAALQKLSVITNNKKKTADAISQYAEEQGMRYAYQKQPSR